MSTKPLKFTPLNAIPSFSVDSVEKQEQIVTPFNKVAEALHSHYRALYGGDDSSKTDAIALIAVVGEFIGLMERLDVQYGADGAVSDLADIDDATDQALRCILEIHVWLERLNLQVFSADLQAVTLGIGVWAMRHDVGLLTLEPIVSALAERANATNTRQDTAAIFALMQGFVDYLKPSWQADLERSNPQRPWRLLNLNLAITSVRSGDAAMMRYAFDALNTNLPDESRGFYEEAYAIATQPGFPAETRALIEVELAKASQLH
jgi:hypothetical protein